MLLLPFAGGLSNLLTYYVGNTQNDRRDKYLQSRMNRKPCRFLHSNVHLRHTVSVGLVAFRLVYFACVILRHRHFSILFVSS